MTARKLSPTEVRALNEAMLEVFTGPDDLQRCLYYECNGQRLNDITVADSMTTKVHTVAEYFMAAGRLEELVDGVHRHRPTSPAFCAFLEDHWYAGGGATQNEAQRRSPASDDGNKPRQSRTKPSVKASVYGIVVGETRLRDSAVQRLGQPTQVSIIRGKPVAAFANHGLVITFDGDLRGNPGIEMLRVSADAAELPFGLRPFASVREVVRTLDGVYDTAQADPDAPVLMYEPKSGSDGHDITVQLRGGRLEHLSITAPQELRKRDDWL
jgi:hypothetical protein